MMRRRRYTGIEFAGGNSCMLRVERKERPRMTVLVIWQRRIGASGENRGA